MQDTKELVVASGGDVFVAPVGSEIPDDPTTALDDAFLQLDALGAGRVVQA